MTSVRPTIVVIGNFDGVHRGHRAVIEAARADAADGGRVVAVTFHPHPLTVIRPDLAPNLLCSIEERCALLREAGVDEVVVVEFTREVMNSSPEEFVASVLVPLHPTKVVVGKNFTFGRKAVGTPATLAEIGAGSFTVEALDLVDDASSTEARHALVDGDVQRAADILGRPYRFSGEVVKGDQRGRELGFPTANVLVPPARAVPADGVYAGWLTAHCTAPGVGDIALPAAISVGTNPTFDGVQRRVESYVLDRTDLELYGVTVDVDFIARLRGQVKYTGIDPLIAQITADVVDTRTALGLPDSRPLLR
ncbi:bifunctional riboflavin kinase/FAD synthetase [Propionibacteriaceae bacterium Y1685]